MGEIGGQCEQGLEPGLGQRLGKALRKGSSHLHLLEKYIADPSPSVGSFQEFAELPNQELLWASSYFSY